MRLSPRFHLVLDRVRSLRGRNLVAALGLAGLTAWAGAASWYIVFHDEILAGLMSRQGAVQYAYEERIGTLKVRLDRLASQKLLDDEAVERRLADLAKRQAAVESRQDLLNTLAEQALDVPAPARAAAPPPLPERASAYAPVPRQTPEATGLGLRGFEDGPTPTQGRRSSLPLAGRVASLAETLDALDARQTAMLGTIADRAGARAVQLRVALAETGLSLSRFAKPSDGVGGPLVPVGGGPFATGFAVAQRSLTEVGDLRRMAGAIPLQRPTGADLGVTSTFGYRSDPFTRGLALHTGVDLRAEYGAAARATAAGRVVSAEYAGGYGNMVEVDHGHGLTTRYAHLSAFAVTPGQTVSAGQIVGRVGSTGRSTGSHLHYETRIDGEPVDPQRFLRAGAKLFGTTLVAAR